MSFIYLLFSFFGLLFSSHTRIGVHAQIEDGSTNPVDTNEPPARLVCCLSDINLYINQIIFSSKLPIIYIIHPLYFCVLRRSPNLECSNIAQVTQAGYAALVIYDNNDHHRLCWNAPVEIYQHSDSIDRITIYTGFPWTPAAAPAKTQPKYSKNYERWGHRNLYFDLDGCLRVGEFVFFYLFSFSSLLGLLLPLTCPWGKGKFLEGDIP